MVKESEPAIFKNNPEYKNWKREQSGAIPPFQISTQELPASPLYESRLRRYEDQVIPVWEKVVDCWKTEKARVAELVPLAFPKGTFIPQLVVKANDKRALEEAMFSLYRKDETWLGLRTCYLPDWMEDAPWKMGIRSEGDIRKCLNEDYPGWLETKSPKGGRLEEIIVLGNPPLLGQSEFEERHFVFMASALPHQIIVEAKLGTSQLRDLEGNTEGFIEITKPLSETYSRIAELPRTIFGINYWDKETLEKIGSLCLKTIKKVKKTFNLLPRLQGLSGAELTISDFEMLSRENPSFREWEELEKEIEEEITSKKRNPREIDLEEIKKDLRKIYVEDIMNQQDIKKDIKIIASVIFTPGFLTVSEEALPYLIRDKIRTAMLEGKINKGMLDSLINARARIAAEDLENLIFEKWLQPPIDLYYRLVALNNVCVRRGQTPGRGNDTIEVQGAYGQDGKIEYALIQSVRGREEKELGERAKVREKRR